MVARCSFLGFMSLPAPFRRRSWNSVGAIDNRGFWKLSILFHPLVLISISENKTSKWRKKNERSSHARKNNTFINDFNKSYFENFWIFILTGVGGGTREVVDWCSFKFLSLYIPAIISHPLVFILFYFSRPLFVAASLLRIFHGQFTEWFAGFLALKSSF